MPNRRKRRRTRARRSRQTLSTLLPILAAVVVVAVAVTVAIVVLTPKPQPKTAPAPVPAKTCPQLPSVNVKGLIVPAGPVAGFCQDTLVNAAEIMAAGHSYGLDTHYQTVGIMTAIGESGLQNLGYGDKAGPDSRGLFQQRTSWGTLQERLDPYTSARLFFWRMLSTPGWNTLNPNDLAHSIQRNADPHYYAQFWMRAVEVVAAINHAPKSALSRPV